MLFPEPMSRIVIVGSKSRIDEAIDALYELELVHLIDHTVGADEGFSIGTPRPYSEKASERLLTLRAMENELGIDINRKAGSRMSVKEVRAKISSNRIESIGKGVFKALDRKNEIVKKMADEEARRHDLSLLSDIPVDLELYKGYGSIVSVVGTIKPDQTGALARIPNSELFLSRDGKTMALFVKKSEKDNAMRILADLEFTEIAVPDGKGSISANIAKCDEKITSLKASLDAVEIEIAALRKKHGPDILALDEEVSVDVRKGELPLRIAMSKYSYLIDAWVPTEKVGIIASGLNEKLGSSVYVERQEDRTRNLHEVDAAEERFKRTPTKLKTGAYVKHFEHPVKLMSTPKYQEINPMIILSIFFPLFFGFMVGDIGYAIPFIILGAYGLKTAKTDDFRAIATILFFGGIWTFIFGFFFYGEMLGMHFVGDFDGTQHTWASLLSLTFPEWFINIFPEHGHGISKLTEVTFLLKISIFIGIGHLFLGYILGFINVKLQSGTKEAFFAKGGWMMSFVGVVLACWALTEVLISGKPWEGMVLIAILGGVALVVAGTVVTWREEKAAAVMELPGIIGNILSYARLTAIGMSKAGMALAFNYIAIIMFVDGLGGIFGLIAGFALFTFGHFMIWMLAILSAGLHSLRLQYVELMSKFFVGDGKDYEPLEIKRKNTKS